MSAPAAVETPRSTPRPDVRAARLRVGFVVVLGAVAVTAGTVVLQVTVGEHAPGADGPPPPAPPPPAAVPVAAAPVAQRVTYELTGGPAADLTYVGHAGDVRQEQAVKAPWSRTLDRAAGEGGGYYSLSARGRTAGLTCRILLDGVQVTERTAAPGELVTCSASSAVG
ncbi:MmpS family transport accessory protein [Amycolatopsis suaedae]|uniref:Uncharacterized protein n=1 Tax=Amycolatopsis suaedae TaxID=2510978 RepID=A0A4Q7J5U9_9PSEU|nr:MmpS family transport accessory protein [Amycolatopsis suaedae]RZQ62971.1 hypothetical protein EWH70_14845 [Amycolatopsis suaedae]